MHFIIKGKLEKMVDRYTKTVLTIIAVALCALVLQDTVRPVGALGEGCGGYFDPCHVEVTGTPTVDVNVRRMPSVQVWND